MLEEAVSDVVAAMEVNVQGDVGAEEEEEGVVEVEEGVEGMRPAEAVLAADRGVEQIEGEGEEDRAWESGEEGGGGGGVRGGMGAPPPAALGRKEGEGMDVEEEGGEGEGLDHRQRELLDISKGLEGKTRVGRDSMDVGGRWQGEEGEGEGEGGGWGGDDMGARSIEEEEPIVGGSDGRSGGDAEFMDVDMGEVG